MQQTDVVDRITAADLVIDRSLDGWPPKRPIIHFAMSEFLVTDMKLPPEQLAIRAKCFHPSGRFEEFTKEEVEQSIPERFEKIVKR
ncbi:MAG TPA: hypothetical protein VIB79_12405, partial [Candidatus Binatia bacterium]